MKLNDLVDERGMLLPDAKRFLNERFGRETNNILNWANSESELRLLGSILNSYVNDLISNKLKKII